MNIADLRKSYEKAELSESASNADPLLQFSKWLEEAISSEVPEPNAMTVATVGSNLRPSTRVVLIKGYDERGIVWYTNYDSRKGQELAGNPFAALQFHWVELERTVRIEGRVEKVSAEESDAYFHSRPLDSRVGAWASPQSEVISGRGVLVANVTADGPAAKAGLKRNDIIISFGGQDVLDLRRFPKIVANARVGNTVDVVVWRGAKEVPLKLRVGEQEEAEKQNTSAQGTKKPAEPDQP
eukprot:gene37874-49634_t